MERESTWNVTRTTQLKTFQLQNDPSYTGQQRYNDFSGPGSRGQTFVTTGQGYNKCPRNLRGTQPISTAPGAIGEEEEDMYNSYVDMSMQTDTQQMRGKQSYVKGSQEQRHTETEQNGGEQVHLVMCYNYVKKHNLIKARNYIIRSLYLIVLFLCNTLLYRYCILIMKRGATLFHYKTNGG